MDVFFKDPRLKPVVIPTPTQPFCTYGAFLPMPIVALASYLVLSRQEDLMKAARALERPTKSMVTIICFAGASDPIHDLMLYQLALCVLIASLFGLLLVWFGYRRIESQSQVRSMACLFNSLGLVLMSYGLFSLYSRMVAGWS